MKKYHKKDFTWGYEIEWGDIDRTLKIPEHLGTWEYAETDIVNIHDPYKYIATDPLGLLPPMGGEINTKPTASWPEQVFRILEIKKLFEDHGNTPSSSCVNHGHLHVFVPGLKEDIGALRGLTDYIRRNQAITVEKCYGFKERSDMSLFKNAKPYLKLDGGRLMPDYMSKNIIEKAEDFDSFIKMHAAGKDGVSMGRPFRYAINMYCMKHTGTIEFRCFRSTTDTAELIGQFQFVNHFMDAALNNGPDVPELFEKYWFTFPKFIWNANEYSGWINTKWPKERGPKQRAFYPVSSMQEGTV